MGEEYLQALEAYTKAIPPGKYRHYKGGEYEVLHIAVHSESLEPMVVYRALYGQGAVWVRPAKMWSEPVAHNNGVCPRFSKID